MDEKSLSRLMSDELINLMLENVNELLDISKEPQNVKAIEKKTGFIQLIHKVIVGKMLEKQAMNN